MDASRNDDVRRLPIGSVGLGSRGGPADDGTDARYLEVLVEGGLHGARLFDTGIHYREGRSEAVLGRALAKLRNRRRRDPSIAEPVVCSKGGPIHFASPGERPWPELLDAQVDCSRNQLGVERIDVYYLDGLESVVVSGAFHEIETSLLRAFAALENLRHKGWIRYFGVSSRTGLLKKKGSPEFLPLDRLVEIARAVGGPNHGLRFVQCPYSITRPTAFVARNQYCAGTSCSLIRAAKRLGLSFVAAATLGSGAALEEITHPWLSGVLKRGATPAQRAIQFVRSTPGVSACLIGTTRIDHLLEDLAIGSTAPASEETFAHLVPPEAPQVPWLYGQ